jgi:hypothetical protein
MEKQTKAQQLREFLILAKKLRASAAESGDSAYIDLFLRAATALEDRAHRLAYDVPLRVAGAETKPASRVPVDFTC